MSNEKPNMYIKTLTEVIGKVYMTSQRGKQTSKKLVLTPHAINRYSLRARDGEEGLRKLAKKARYNGINLDKLTKNDVYGNESLYNYLKNCFHQRNKSQDIRVYDRYVFVFAGHHSRTLVTFINIPEQLLKERV